MSFSHSVQKIIWYDIISTPHPFDLVLTVFFTSQHPTMHLYFSVSERTVSCNPNNRITVWVSFFSVSEHTPPEEGKRASLSDYWWAVCLCSRPIDTSTLSLSHTVSAAVQGPASSSTPVPLSGSVKHSFVPSQCWVWLMFW